jgi:hypothetical protein
MRLLLLILPLAVVLASANPLHAQRKQQAYILTDSSLLQGYVRPLRNGTIEYKQTNYSQPRIFKLSDLNEYSVHGSIYEALVVNGQRDFYERMIKGNSTLYRGRGRYVIKSNGLDTPLEKNNFRSVMGSVLKCDGRDQTYSTLAWSKVALKQLVRKSNKGNCNADGLPYRKVGVYAGYNLLNYTLSTAYFSLSGKTNAPSIGVFIDLPTYMTQFIYFTVDVNAMAAKPALYTARDNMTTYIDLSVQHVNMQGAFKFIATKGALRPYCKLGGFVSFSNFKAKDGIIETSENNSVIETTKDIFEGGKVNPFGINLAGGLEWRLNKKKNVHFEVKYMKSATIKNFSSVDLRYSNLAFLLGFNI